MQQGALDLSFVVVGFGVFCLLSFWEKVFRTWVGLLFFFLKTFF